MEELFNLWLKSISELCINKYYKKRDRYFIDQYNDKKEELIYEYRQFYDPHFNFTTEFLEGIDVDFSQLWYQYRPCATYDKNFSGWKLHNKYNLKVISPITLKTFPKNIKIKEKYAIKRYYNSVVESITVFYINQKPNVFPLMRTNLRKEKIKIKYIKIEDDINLSLYKFKEYSDLIVLYLEESNSDLIIDCFIPAYPIWLDEKIIVLTPILLQQLNGCDNKNRIQSLYNRIADNLGAVILNTNKIFPLPKYEENFSSSYSGNELKDDIKKGISDYETGIFKDGRVKRNIPEYTKHIPKYGHGWISLDTQIGIISALEALESKAPVIPKESKVILELGAWLGLSTRIFSNHSKIKTTIYSIDVFDNNAIYDKSQSFTKPSEKLYNHLRYETFCSNVSNFKKSSSLDLTSRYYFDEPINVNSNNEFVLMKMDIYEGIEIIHKSGIKPDLILIDFEKKTAKLLGVLKKLKQYFPNSTIIGDDYVFPSVREAVRIAALNFTYTMKEAYIISNNQNNYKSIIENIKKNRKIYEVSKEQKKALKDSNEGLLLEEPFLKIRNQSSYNINYFTRFNRDLAIKIVEMIYKSQESNSQKPLYFPIPLHNPASLTFFDYFFLSSKPENILE